MSAVRSPTFHVASSFVSAQTAVQVVAGAGGGLLAYSTLLLRVDERPDFVDLQPLAGEIAQRLVLVGTADGAGFAEELGDSALRAGDEAIGSGHAVPFHQEHVHVCHVCSLGRGKPIHLFSIELRAKRRNRLARKVSDYPAR